VTQLCTWFPCQIPHPTSQTCIRMFDSQCEDFLQCISHSVMRSEVNHIRSHDSCHSPGCGMSVCTITEPFLLSGNPV
jgi:hypothetical protein